MAEDTRARSRLLPYLLSLPTLSLLIASLSLASSITQSFNYRKNIESVQQNVLRAENLKTCRDIIEVFFAFRLKAEEANAARLMLDAPARELVRREMKAAVYRFGALGTYLANFAPAAMRARYTALSHQLNAIADGALRLEAPEFDRLFTEADGAFGSLNEDCVKAMQFVAL